MQLKIDVDGSFYKWFQFFKKQYPYFSVKVKFDSGDVWKTQHGYHVYLYSLLKSERNINLYECLLGSDLRKQNYCFVEGNDVLFVDREFHVTKYTALLLRFINKVSRQNSRLDIYVHKNNGEDIYTTYKAHSDM